MANIFIPKRSSVPGKVPLPADLQVGELAVNLADRTIYTKDSTNAVVAIGGGASLEVPSVDQTFYPTAGTTTISVAYTPGAEHVYKNGSKLIRGADYTATTGTTIVLSAATVTDDVLQVVVNGTPNVFVQNTTPTFPVGVQSFWVQTGLGVSGNDFTFWINT